jgi:hypothetical protein
MFALLVASICAGSAWADEAALSLVRPNSLTGWSHGDAPPIGWTVDGQRLRGCEAGSPLVSGWTFGDFTLDLAWQAIDEGSLEVLLPSSPEGDLLSITFDNQTGGKIIDGDKQRSAGRKLSASNDLHRCRIKRAGETLRVTIDDEPVSEMAVASERRFGLSLNVPLGVVVVEGLAIREPLGEAIFNGTDLTGWTTHRKQDVWTVENGELTTTKNGGEYLRSEREYGNFTLTYDYLLARGGNSGLGIRTPRGGWPSGDGMELQMLDRPGKESGSQMSIYRHVPPLERPDISDAWNHVVVKCEGPIVTAWVNGQIAQHVDLDQYPQLAKKPRSGWLGFQHHGSKTRIKNVHLLDNSADAAAVGEGKAAAP